MIVEGIEDALLFALIASWIGVTIALIGMILSNQRATEALNQNAKVANNALMGELLDRFSSIVQNETILISLDPSDIKHEPKFNRYATDYLNTTDRLLYLYEKDMIPKDVFNYFKHFVSFSKEHFDWKTSMYGEDVIKEKWKIVYDYLEKHNIQSKSRTLPTSMYDFVATYKSKP